MTNRAGALVLVVSAVLGIARRRAALPVDMQYSRYSVSVSVVLDCPAFGKQAATIGKAVILCLNHRRKL